MTEPWMKFFTGDYFRDPGVRSVSLAARGLWMDMLCLMHQSARKGYLQHPSGLPFTPVQLARMVGYGVEEIAPVLQELDDSGVFSRTKDGVIYSRRMDRDARKSAACSEAGRRGGGNPALGSPINDTYKGESKGGDKGPPKGGVKPQKSEVRSQKSETEPPNPQPSAGGGVDGHLSKEEIWRRICGCVGRPSEKAKSGLEMQALHELAAVTEAEMRLVERYVEQCRLDPQKHTKPKALAHTLLAEFWSEVGKARLMFGKVAPAKKALARLPDDWPRFVAALPIDPAIKTELLAWKAWDEVRARHEYLVTDYHEWRKNQ